jgi:hypothetical protein
VYTRYNYGAIGKGRTSILIRSKETPAKQVTRQKATSQSKINAAPSRSQMKRTPMTPEENAKLRNLKKGGSLEFVVVYRTYFCYFFVVLLMFSLVSL